MLSAKGAALRGILPRRADTLLSFTDVGTEEIYEWKRAHSFSALFVKISVLVGLFFVTLYAGSYVLISRLAARTESREASRALVSEDLVRIQEEAKKFNQALLRADELSRRAPQWDKLFASIASITNPGITLSSIASDGPEVTIAGVARSRDALLQMKATIATGAFEEVELPFALLVEREDIAFRLTLKLRNPAFFLTQ
jgi:Tfp pilus assembly protein PilN